MGWPYFQLGTQNYTIALNRTAIDLIAIISLIVNFIGGISGAEFSMGPWPLGTTTPPGF